MGELSSGAVVARDGGSGANPAQSANAEWRCKSIDDNEPNRIDSFTLMVENRSKVKTVFTADKCSTGYLLDEKYKPRDKERKKYDKFKYVPSEDACNFGDGALTPIYLEKIIFEGGRKLSDGSRAAFFTIAGAGYSWAKYKCVLQTK